MVFTLTGSVGIPGDNRPHDIAKVQAALKVLKRKSGAPYYLGAVDGDIRSVKLALADFLRDHKFAANLKGERTVPRKIERIGFLRNQIISAIKGHRVLDYEAIRGTGILYVPGNDAPVRRHAKDFLILERLKPPTALQIGEAIFPTRYEVVSIDINDFYHVELSLVGIKSLVHPMILQPQALRANKQMMTLLGRVFSQGEWEIPTAVLQQKTYSTGFSLKSKRKTGIGRAYTDLYKEGKTAIHRVMVPTAGTKIGLKVSIPAQDQALAMAVEIYTAICAGPAVTGVKADIDKRVQEIVQDIVKGAPNIRADLIAVHCKTCKELSEAAARHGAELRKLREQYWSPQMREDIRKLEESLLVLDLTGRDTTGFTALVDSLVGLFENTVAERSLIVDADDLKNGQPDIDLGDLVSIGEEVSRDLMENVPQNSKFWGLFAVAYRFLRLASIILFVADIGKAVYAIASDERSFGDQARDFANAVAFVVERQEALAFMKERGNALILELQNLALFIENEALALQVTIFAMAKQSCGDGYADLALTPD